MTTVISFEDSNGRVYSFHAWADVSYSQEHEVTDKPTGSGTTSTVIRKLPRIVGGLLKCADRMNVSPTGDGSDAVQRQGMLEQLTTLYSLEGQNVTVYARTLPPGGVSGILRSISVEDSGEFDNSVSVRFLVRSLTTDSDIDSEERGEIAVPVPGNDDDMLAGAGENPCAPVIVDIVEDIAFQRGLKVMGDALTKPFRELGDAITSGGGSISDYIDSLDLEDMPEDFIEGTGFPQLIDSIQDSDFGRGVSKLFRKRKRVVYETPEGCDV